MALLYNVEVRCSFSYEIIVYMVESVATEGGWYSYRIEVNRTVVNLYN